MLNTDADASAFPRGQRYALVAPRIRRTCSSIAADQKTKGPADVLTPLPFRAPKAHNFSYEFAGLYHLIPDLELIKTFAWK